MPSSASEQNHAVSQKDFSRREFLKVGGAAAVIGVAGVLAGDQINGTPQARAANSGKVKYGMVIDLDRCLGCRACMVACKVENNTPAAAFWMYVFRTEEGHYPNVRIQYTPRPCMHCDNAPCAKVCPVGARYKREDGLVATDADRCIGCRYCQVACPYSVNYFNWEDPKKNQYYDWVKEAPEIQQATGGVIPPYQNPDHELLYGAEKRRISGGSHHHGVMGKCTFCVHRIEKGLLPACVANCPAGVYSFGDLNDPDSEVSRRLNSEQSFTLAEDLGTKPRVHYLGTSPLKDDTRQIDAIVRRV